MNKMTIDTLIAYFEDFKRNLVPGKQLYVQVNGELLVCSDKECKKVEASIWKNELQRGCEMSSKKVYKTS